MLKFLIGASVFILAQSVGDFVFGFHAPGFGWQSVGYTIAMLGYYVFLRIATMKD